MSEEYRKFVEKHMIKIVPEEEKVKIHEYGQTEEGQRQYAKQIYQRIRERDKP